MNLIKVKFRSGHGYEVSPWSNCGSNSCEIARAVLMRFWWKTGKISIWQQNLMRTIESELRNMPPLVLDPVWSHNY